MDRDQLAPILSDIGPKVALANPRCVAPPPTQDLVFALIVDPLYGVAIPNKP